MKNFLLKKYYSNAFYEYKDFWYVLLICVGFFILRFPSLLEPNWYGDEGIYQVIGRAINDGRVLYKEAWDNKPPLLYLIYAIVNGNLFLAKLLSLISGLFSIVVMYFLSRELFRKSYVVYITTVLFAFLFATPILEGNIANAENFMLLPILLSSYLIFKYLKNPNITLLILSGFFLSIALVTKIVAVFDFLAFFTFILFTKWIGERFIVKNTLIFILSFLSLMLFFSVIFFTTGAFNDFWSGVFVQNISYVGEQYGSAFPTRIIFIKTIILVVAVFIIIAKRKILSRTSFFIYLWLVFSIYNAFFSDRPYTHYLLVLLPAFVILVGHFFENRKWTRLIDTCLIILIVFFAYTQIKIYKKTVMYYDNLIQFLFNEKSVVEYQSFFDRNTPRDYNIANFIKMSTKSDENVFLISNSAQVYALADKLPIGKYMVYYHIIYYRDADQYIAERIDTIRPKYIISTTNSPLIKDLLTSYQLKYIMEGAKIYEREI